MAIRKNAARPEPILVPCAACPLRRQDIFKKATAEEIAFIQQLKIGELVLPAGSQVMREDVPTGEYFTLLGGWAFRYRTLSSGARQILNFLLPGDFLGLQEKLDGKAAHGVELLTDGVLCRFPGERLFDVYRSHPALGYDLTWLAAHEELIMDENLVSVGQRSAPQRIAMLLIHLFKRAESVGLKDEDDTVPFPVTQQHMSDALGLSLVHTHRTLRRLQHSGLFHVEDGRLAIRKPKALRHLADYYALPLRDRPLI
ncbi:MAG: Crp/Fnr family transcriptional regulator [Steroidobacteraceae bacterium]